MPAVAWRTRPFPSGASKVTNRPQGASWMPASMTTPRDRSAATSPSRSSVSSTVPLTAPAGMVGNQVTSVTEVAAPDGLTCTQRWSGPIGMSATSSKPRVST